MATILAANLIIQDNSLLMLYRNDKGYWELPGGKMEENETPRAAAIREAKEEIGCKVLIRSSWGKFDLDFDHEGKTFHTRGFISEIVEGKPEPQEEKFSEIAWVDEQELLDLDLAPNLRIIINELRLLLKRDV